MERINGQVIDFKRLANQVLSWIVCAKRPLTIRELQHALAVEVGESQLNKHSLLEIEDMVTSCAGLVTVDEESGIIRLIHYTTQEYFEQTQKSWFPTAEVEITKICMTYLSFSVFEGGWCETSSKFKDRLQRHPFYDYAARNWGYHARPVEAEVEHMIKLFFDSKAKVSSSCQAIMASRGFDDRREFLPFEFLPSEVTGPHLSAYFGLTEMMMVLLKDQKNLELQDSGGRTPLFYAVDNGQEAMVKLLLEKGAKLETKCIDSRTPLSYAAGSGHDLVTKFLLEKGAELETKTETGRTPLSIAATLGNEAVVTLLLEKGAELETRSWTGDTPLSYAAFYGNEAVVTLLLEKGAKLETRSWTGDTPLSHAAGNGHDLVIKFLLEKGAELETKSKTGRTPLSYAAGNGYDLVIKFLLEKGAELETKTKTSRTSLSFAAEAREEAVVKLLLDHGADPMSESNDGETPLDYATVARHAGIVKLLLDKGAHTVTGSLKRKRRSSQ